MSLTLSLNAAVSGLQTAQRGIDTVSTNIANLNTPGYSRKILEQETRIVAGAGAGVQVAAIARRVDENLIRDVRRESAILASLTVRNRYQEQIQDSFGRVGDDTALSHQVTELSKAFEQLALSGDQPAQRRSTVREAQDMAGQLNRLSDQIQNLRRNADRDIAANVSRANALLTSLHDLNQKVSLQVGTNSNATDLQDQMDRALNALSKLMDIQYFRQSSGAVVVYTQAGQALLDNSPRLLSHNALSTVIPAYTQAGGSFDGINLNGVDITNELRGGEIKALIDLRDGELPNLQAQVDELAGRMVEEVNRIHNRGTSFPFASDTVTGSRRFLDTATQTVRFGSGDTTIALLNADGSQRSASTVQTIMGGAGPYTMNALAAGLQGWLVANGAAGATVGFTTDGKMQIDLNTNTVSLALRDEVATAAGSARQDASLGFDANGDGTVDDTITGFSNFFGLNDLFVVDRPADFTHDSGVKPQGWRLPTGSASFSFSDETGLNFASIAVPAGATLQDIANAINGNAQLQGRINATVVPDGDGQRLRLTHEGNEDFVVTQAGGTAAIDALGLGPSRAGVAQDLAVSPVLLGDDNRLSRGVLQWDADNNRYFASNGDNTNANDLAALFSGSVAFDAVGGLSGLSDRFEAYAASIVTNASSQAATVENDLEFQRTLSSSLQQKEAAISDVNLDEELAQLLAYEQAYNAAARVIQTTDNLLQILTDLIR